MKTLLKKTITTTLATICLLITIPATAISTDSAKYENETKSLEMTATEIAEMMAFLDDEIADISDDSITYEIYNEQDELVSSITAKRNEPLNDKNFIKLMAQSDFFMEFGNTSIYRLDKK